MAATSYITSQIASEEAFALTKTVQVFSKGITGLYINGLYITDLVAWAKITTTWLTNRAAWAKITTTWLT
ncbi:MAG: hypothetical protein WBF33_38165, partial [Candidatus Nitrosopolaris sp.]